MSSLQVLVARLHAHISSVLYGIVEGVGPEDAGAALDGGVEPRVGGLVGPGVVGVIETGGHAAVEGPVETRELAEVGNLGLEAGGGGEFAIATDVLGEGGVGGDGPEDGLSAVAVGVDESRGDDLPSDVDLRGPVGEVSRGRRSR